MNKYVAEPVPDWVTEPDPLDKNRNISFFTETLESLDIIMHSMIFQTFVTT